MSLILQIDTAQENASVSLAAAGVVIAIKENSIQKDHAAFLHKAAAELFREAQLTVKSIDAVAVTAGPGSYTGLRVGLTAAKGFAYALQKPLIMIDSLLLMAMAQINKGKFLQENFLYCPLIDARRSEVFTAIFDEQLTQIISSRPEIITSEFLSAELQSNTCVLFGSGAEKVKRFVKNSKILFTDDVPVTEAFCVIAAQRFKDKRFNDVATSIPLYTKDFQSF